MCTKPVLLCAAVQLGVVVQAENWEHETIKKLDDFFHVPRHEPYIELSKRRVQTAVQSYADTNRLEPWIKDAHDYLCKAQ